MADTEFFCTVVSVVPFQITEEKPGLVPGRFTIPAARNGDVQLLHIGRCQHHVYLDENRGSMIVYDAPDQVASAIVADYINSQLAVTPDAYPGLFWVLGKLSQLELKTRYKAEIDAARIAQKRWFVAICKIADDDWARYGKHNAISDFQRFAANDLGYNPEQHPWMSPEIAMQSVKCPACGLAVSSTLVVCPGCRCVLKQEEYKKLQFA